VQRDFTYRACCQVQLWVASGASSSTVQKSFDLERVQRPSRQDFLQVVQDFLSMYDLPFAEKAVIVVVSGDEAGRSETYDNVVSSFCK
jgi:hypothetical protein